MFKILNFFNKKPNENNKVQSFTYFIPSPPRRTSGYREKQFDMILNEIINSGFKILKFKTCQSSGHEQSGMWVIFILQAKNKIANDINLEEINKNLTKNSEGSEIDGFYYIKD